MTKKCSKCGSRKATDRFCKKTAAKDGLQPACKDCMNVAYNKCRKKKQGHYQALQRKRCNANTALMRQWKHDRGCFVCGETFAQCLELHHIDPTQKDYDPSEMTGHSFESFLREAEKCLLLCANCHRKAHNNYFGV